MPLLDNIFNSINAGLNVLAGVQNQPHNSTNAASITNAISQLVVQLNQLEVGFAALPATQRLQNGDTALQAARQIQTALAGLHGTGTDATYLTNAQNVTVAVIAHIQQMIGEAQTALNQTPVNPTTTPVNPTVTPVITGTDNNGNPIYIQIPANTTAIAPATGQLIAGVDNNLLLIGAGAIILVLLMK